MISRLPYQNRLIQRVQRHGALSRLFRTPLSGERPTPRTSVVAATGLCLGQPLSSLDPSAAPLASPVTSQPVQWAAQPRQQGDFTDQQPTYGPLQSSPLRQTHSTPLAYAQITDAALPNVQALNTVASGVGAGDTTSIATVARPMAGSAVQMNAQPGLSPLPPTLQQRPGTQPLVQAQLLPAAAVKPAVLQTQSMPTVQSRSSTPVANVPVGQAATDAMQQTVITAPQPAAAAPVLIQGQAPMTEPTQGAGDATWQRLQLIMRKHKEQEAQAQGAKPTLTQQSSGQPTELVTTQHAYSLPMATTAVQTSVATQALPLPLPNPAISGQEEKMSAGLLSTDALSVSRTSEARQSVNQPNVPVALVQQSSIPQPIVPAHHSSGPTATGTAESAPAVQPVPLEAVWPVQRVTAQSGFDKTGGDAALLEKAAGADRTAAVVAAAFTDIVKRQMQTLPATQPTDAQIDIVPPRRPRPVQQVRASGLAVIQQRNTPADQSQPDTGAAANKIADQQPPTGTGNDSGQRAVETEIGALPAYLWQAIGETPPPSPAQTRGRAAGGNQIQATSLPAEPIQRLTSAEAEARLQPGLPLASEQTSGQPMQSVGVATANHPPNFEAEAVNARPAQAVAPADMAETRPQASPQSTSQQFRDSAGSVANREQPIGDSQDVSSAQPGTSSSITASVPAALTAATPTNGFTIQRRLESTVEADLLASQSNIATAAMTAIGAAGAGIVPQATDVDVDELARKVYRELRHHFVIERERFGSIV